MSTLSKWLQPPSKDSIEQQYQELANLLRTKERALETTSHDLKVKTAAMQILEQKVMSSESTVTSVQRELSARTEQIKALETELAARSNRVTALEAEGDVVRQRMTDLNLIISDQAEELRGAQQARHAAEQAQDVLKEEIRVLRDHITQLNEGLTDRNYLRTQLEKMGAAQDRVHRLEIEFSDREAAHRATIQQLEKSIAERDQRIHQFDAATATQVDELRDARQACHAAEQAQDVLKEEIRVLRDHITQLNEGLADRDRLRAQVAKLDSTQDRVHQLEVELSDREAAHRATIQQLEKSIAERDKRISKIDTTAAAQAEELREAQQARHAIERTQEALNEEIRILRDRIAQLDTDLADREQRITNFEAGVAEQAEGLREADQARHAAEQSQTVLKEEIRVLRDHIAQLNEGLAERDRLRSQIKKLDAMRDRVHQLEVELSDREAAHRSTIQQLEKSIAERDERMTNFDTCAAEQAEKLREADQARHAAEQAQGVLKEEIRVLRDHIAQLGEGLADHDRLRAQIEKLGATQDRVHQLEVELSDREAAHRGTIQQLERTLAERGRKIEKLVPVNHLLREKESEIKEWEKKLTRTVREHEGQVTKLQEQCAAQDQLREQHQLAEHQLREEQRLAKHQLHERDEQIVRLQQQLQDLDTVRQNLTADVQRIPEKDEQITRLRKRPREMQAELRAEASASAKGSSDLKVTPLTNVASGAQPTSSTTTTPTSAGPRPTQGSQDSTRQDFQAKLDKSGVASKIKTEPVTKTATSPKPALESKASPNKTASGTTVASGAVNSRQGRPNGTGQDSHAERPKSGATPGTKAEPINKDVLRTKQSPDAKAALPSKPVASAKTAPPSAAPSQTVQNGAGKESHVAHAKSGNGKAVQKDDLQQINGIGPVFAQTLNKLGTYTFIQIARWKPDDIKKISKKLDTDPERIKRENWIADAKKQHFRKYGEKI
ncbi:hypothetical protein YTPLAS72_04540 [Nitrospira sp.]|nr:hypothetical protein YTPLAS72_04540 [Nitrospira sp.]